MKSEVKYRKVEAPFTSCKIENKPYAVAGYAHTDAELVYPIIKKIYEAGIKIWYDDGIEVNDRYDRVLADAIDACQVFILFVSKNSIFYSKYVIKKMLNYADRLNKDIVVCELESVENMPNDIRIKLVGHQRFSKEELQDTLTDELIHELKKEKYKLVPKGSKSINLSKKRTIDLSIDREANLSDYVSETTSEGIILSKYKGFDNDVIVPSSSLDSISVVQIRCTFEYNQYVRSVTIPGSVKLIGDGTFKYCENLISVNILDGVLIIGEDAFKDCRKIRSVTIPSSVTTIKNSAFVNCESLIMIMIPSSVKSIASDAFNGCKALTIICEKNSAAHKYALKHHISAVPLEPNLCNGIPNDRKLIPNKKQTVLSFTDYEYILDEKNNVVLTKYLGSDETVKIPSRLPKDRSKKIVDIDDNAFSGCKAKTIIIPNGIKRIGLSAFSGCKSLTTVKLPRSITLIGDKAFKDCSNLKTVKIACGSKNLEIGNYTFENCSSLASIILPGRVNIIGEGAFYKCKGLKTATIFGNDIKVGKQAFAFCDSLVMHRLSGSKISDYARAIGVPLKSEKSAKKPN